MFVVKNSGDLEEFDPEKIKKTCIRAGASEKVARKVMNEVSKNVYDGIKTREILKLVLKYLGKEMPHVASRYDLKGSIFRLGPAGFLFEKYIAEILKEYGFEDPKVHSIINGECVSHEIDVIAISKNKTYMIECKYHNEPGIYTGIKDVLYTYARFLDLVAGYKKGKCQEFDIPWLVCNTKFSEDSIQYANCRGIKILGWKYPPQLSLEKMIEDKKLYPITMLRSLDRNSREELSKTGLILTLDLVRKDLRKLNELTGISLTKLKTMNREAQILCT